MREQRPAVALGKGHFTQNAIRAEEKTASARPEIILKDDHPAIRKKDVQIVFRAVITAQIGSMKVQRDFTATGCVDQVSQIVSTNHTTLDRTRTCTDNEINRIHNHTALPQCRPFFGFDLFLLYLLIE